MVSETVKRSIAQRIMLNFAIAKQIGQTFTTNLLHTFHSAHLQG